MRLFIAIPLASEVVDALERLSNRLRSSSDNLRWSSPETWHITLQFLGETSAENYNCIVQQLSEIKSPPVPIWLSGTGIFDRVGVFWVGVTVSPELLLLEKAVTVATSGCGFAREDRPYRPHITLARAKSGDRSGSLRKLQVRVKEDLAFPLFTAGEFLLYESFLASNGARHEIRDRFPLG